MLTRAEIINRFSHHAPTEGQVEKYQSIRNYAMNLASYLNTECPQSPELALAIRKLEECMFWANASIARRSDIDSIFTPVDEENGHIGKGPI